MATVPKFFPWSMPCSCESRFGRGVGRMGAEQHHVTNPFVEVVPPHPQVSLSIIEGRIVASDNDRGPCVDVHAVGVGEARRESLFTSMDAAKKTQKGPGHNREESTPSAWCIGVVSAGRQALEGAALARGDNTTLSQLRDQSRRPALPREALPKEFVSSPSRILFWREAGSLTTFGKPDGARHQALRA